MRGHVKDLAKADDRDLSVRAVDPDGRMNMVMSMQDQIDAVLLRSARSAGASVNCLMRESERSG